MIYITTQQLREFLSNGFAELAALDEHIIDEADCRNHLLELRTRPEKERMDAAVFRCLTWGKKPGLASKPSGQSVDNTPVLEVLNRINDGIEIVADFLRKMESDAEARRRETSRLLKRSAIAALIVSMIFFGLNLAYGMPLPQNVNPAIVVANCATVPANYPTAGNRAPATVNQNGQECVSGTFTVSPPANQNVTVIGTSVNPCPTTDPCNVSASFSPPANQNVTIIGSSATICPSTAPCVVSGTVTTTAPANQNVTIIGSSATLCPSTAPCNITGAVTVSDGAGALNVIVDSGTLTAVTSITNPVTVTDGAGALNVIVDSGTTIVTQATATNLKAQVTGAGTAGSADTGVITIQGIASGVAVAISAPMATAGVATNSALTIQGIAGGVAAPVSVAQASATGAGIPVQIMGLFTNVSGNITSSVNASVSVSLVSGTASNYLYITACSFNNTSATASIVYLLDGNNGNTLWPLMVPATSGGNNVAFPMPGALKVPTAGNALHFKPATAGAAITGACTGVRSTVSY